MTVSCYPHVCCEIDFQTVNGSKWIISFSLGFYLGKQHLFKNIWIEIGDLSVGDCTNVGCRMSPNAVILKMPTVLALAVLMLKLFCCLTDYWPVSLNKNNFADQYKIKNVYCPIHHMVHCCKQLFETFHAHVDTHRSTFVYFFFSYCVFFFRSHLSVLTESVKARIAGGQVSFRTLYSE